MTSRSPSSPIRPVLLLLALVALVLPAAATAREGGVSISPSRVEQRVKPGSELTPIRVVNTSDRILSVTTTAQPATQGLSGLPDYDTSASALAKGWPVLEVSPRSFTLRPGERVDVQSRVRERPGDEVGAYGVVLITAVPTESAAGGDAEVASAIRLAANVLLRFKGAAEITGAVEAGRAEQGTNRTLEVIGTLRNDGTLHASPRVRFSVRDQAGKVVARDRPLPVTVLPGARRELPWTVTKLLPAGDYSVRIDALTGRRRTQVEFPVRLVGPNELPTARVRVAELTTPRPSAGEDFSVRVRVRNSGTAPLQPEGRLVLRPTGTGTAEQTVRLELPAIAPGAEVERDVPLAGVPKGAYDLELSLWSDGRELDSRGVEFETDVRISPRARFLDWIWTHPVLALCLLAGLVLVPLGAIVALLVQRRRLKRAVAPAAVEAVPVGAGVEVPEPFEALVEATRAAAPPLPVPDVPETLLFFVNVAGPDELARLEGIGPAAAQRIVAHREEYGSFGTLEALARVEGFDAERVAQLAARPTSGT